MNTRDMVLGGASAARIFSASVGPRPVLDAPRESGADLAELSRQFSAHHGEVKGLLERTGARLGEFDTQLQAHGDRLDGFEKRLNRPGSVDMKAGDASAEHKALATFARRGDDAELKAMSVGSDPDGGFLVHPVLSSRMTKRLFDTTPMRQLARVETITQGDAFEEPLDLDDVGATWVGETESRPETSTPQVGILRIPLEEIYANPKVTQRLLDDSGFDIGGWLEGKISDRFGRTEGASFVTGDGVKKPRGFLSYGTSAQKDGSRPWSSLQTVPSGHATEITADGLKDLTWSLRAPYRQGAGWLMNTNTAARIDKLKDSSGAYIWRDSMIAGAPPMLLNYPVTFSEDMPDVVAGAVPIAFGNFKLGYIIVDRAGIKWLRDPFSAKPYVMFYAYKRVGGGLANSEAIKLLLVSAS
ncbi:phage major capsid protein [Enterovirga aerilata]|uniref:Phage major capsid protein n=1 Tax=Enterovirga aerilata TaxID=2730920 RepID=A0A849HWE3_9HYPH|nr:phage major capsid protein [Enterovirga sp. DB1703]NNM71422.1 phage major capsid protein [Enterovirga sp. DB1703]